MLKVSPTRTVCDEIAFNVEFELVGVSRNRHRQNTYHIMPIDAPATTADRPLSDVEFDENFLADFAFVVRNRVR